MVSAFRRALARALGSCLACMPLLLPSETIAGDGAARKPVETQVEPARAGDCGGECAPTAAPRQPSWQEVLDQFGLLLPKIPQMPSACRTVRQYRSISLDKTPKSPCFFA